MDGALKRWERADASAPCIRVSVPRGFTNDVAGDIVGAGINFVTGKAFFTKNGELIGESPSCVL
jgi:hypothetical protein